MREFPGRAALRPRTQGLSEPAGRLLLGHAIARHVIAEILAKTDLVTLIGSHVALRRQGQHFTGLCPFHSERSPSFHVRQDRGFFKCFGCGVGGDAIRFIERIENLPFPEAARFLAKRAGIQLEEETEYSNKMRLVRDAIHSANAIAALYYHRLLLEGPEAEPARAYCTRRGLDAAAIEHFRLGYAPARWDGLAEVLRKAGVENDIALKAGLLKEGQRGLYDFYRGRLMIPTLSMTGETVAFGGRSIDGEEPKYLNTSTTPVYSKGRMLYGLNFARRAAGLTGSLIVVEGYLDCIAMHRAGFEHTVASLGTAFTPEQAELLRRYVTNVYVAFDSDKAGQAATDKSLEMLEGAGCKTRVVALPKGYDPDSYIREFGAEGFQKLLDASLRSSEYRIDRALGELDDGFRTNSDLIEAVEQIIRTEPRIDWDRLRVYVAGKLNISIEELRRAHLQRFVDTRTSARADARLEPVVRTRDHEILALFVEEPALVGEYRERLTPAHLQDPRMRHFYECLLEQTHLESGVDILVAVSSDEEAGDVLLSLTDDERSPSVRFQDGWARREFLERILESFAREGDERRSRELAAQVDALLAEGRPVPRELLDEQQEIESRLYRVLRSGDKS